MYPTLSVTTISTTSTTSTITTVLPLLPLLPPPPTRLPPLSPPLIHLIHSHQPLYPPSIPPLSNYIHPLSNYIHSFFPSLPSLASSNHSIIPLYTHTPSPLASHGSFALLHSTIEPPNHRKQKHPHTVPTKLYHTLPYSTIQTHTKPIRSPYEAYTKPIHSLPRPIPPTPHPAYFKHTTTTQ